jgi:hypothetical protein
MSKILKNLFVKQIGEHLELYKKVRGQVQNKVGQQVCRQVWDKIQNQVCIKVFDQVWKDNE